MEHHIEMHIKFPPTDIAATHQVIGTSNRNRSRKPGRFPPFIYDQNTPNKMQFKQSNETPQKMVFSTDIPSEDSVPSFGGAKSQTHRLKG